MQANDELTVIDRFVRVDAIDREVKRLAKEADAIDAKDVYDLADYVRLDKIRETIETLLAELRVHHRVLMGAFPTPEPRPGLLRRILRR